MKEKLHKSGSVFMALLLLFSTLSFSMDMHFCGDHLVDFSLFDKADSCGMMSAASPASADCAMIDIDMDCCSDVQILIEGQEDFKVSFDQLTFGQQVFLTSLVYSCLNLFEEASCSSPGEWEYAPPPLIRDVQVLHQTFLI
jgi:hypothetical protein